MADTVIKKKPWVRSRAIEMSTDTVQLFDKETKTYHPVTLMFDKEAAENEWTEAQIISTTESDKNLVVWSVERPTL